MSVSLCRFHFHSYRDWEFILDMAANVSVVVAGLVAIWGIWGWRRELKGRRSFELAEKGLIGFYRSRDVMRWMREPGSFGVERRVPSEADESPEDSAAYPPIYRYHQNSELFARLKTLRYEFNVHFGGQAVQPFDALFDIVGNVLAAARHLPARWERERFPDEEARTRHEETVARYEALIWREENDETDQRLESVVKQMEELCRPYLR